MKIVSTFKGLVYAPLIAGIILSFQNCSPVAFQEISAASLGSEATDPCLSQPNSDSCLVTEPPQKCVFNGQSYSEGEKVIAYLASSVPAGQSCNSEERICTAGSFTGSYAYANCQVNAPAACLFNGKTIASGGSVIAYQNSSVPYGQTCVSEARNCHDGTLSGSYNFETCTPGAPASCLFNGQTIAHGGQVMAYPTSSVPFGATCAGTMRTCNNGVLSGSGAFASCAPESAASCLFNGQTIPHQGVVRAYQASSVAFGQTCSAQDRVCNNGTLSGTYAFASCSVGTAASCLFNGQTVAHGQSVTAYQSSSVGYGQTCMSQQRTCNNGNLSGTYLASTCTVASCVATQGQACEKDIRYYWESTRFDSLDACEMYKGNLGFQAPCPATSAGYEWSGKTCRSDSAPTNGKWMARLLCAESRMGVVSCDGTCQ